MIWYIWFIYIGEYATIAVNTIVDCSLLNIGSSNKKKRKIEECNDEKHVEKEWVPAPKLIKVRT